MVSYNITVFLIIIIMFAVVLAVGLALWYTRRRVRDETGLRKSTSDLA